MKKRLLFILMCSTSGLYHCQENVEPEQGEVVFTFALPIGAEGKNLSGIPEGTTAEISISKGDDQQLQTFHDIELVRAGNQYTSASVGLTPGNYRIENFLVTKNGNVFLAASGKGRILSSTLKPSPLPTFTVGTRTVTTIPLEVVDLRVAESGSSFRQEIARPLNITVFAHKNGKLRKTHADFQLLRGDSVLLNSSLFPKLNVLPFPVESSATYQLVISKEGYHDVLMDFNYEAFLLENGSASLEIILEEKTAASFTAIGDVTLYLTLFKAGTVIVEWPDDTEETITFKPSPTDPDKLSFIQASHTQSGTGTVSLSGDVGQIVELITVTPITRLDISNLDNLQSLTIENATLSQVNLSRNEALATLAIINTSLDRIVLPDNHAISSIQIERTPGHQTSLPINDLIDNIFQNSVTNNITEGAFILLNAGELSPSSLQKLEILQTAYSWYVEIE